MELSPRQQGFELIQKSKKILLVTKKNPTTDSIGSILAMGIILEKLKKEIDLISNGPIDSALSFLPYFDRLRGDLKSSKDFIISVDTSNTKIDQFSYDFDDDGNKLNIFITPKDGTFDTQHITAKTAGFKYDLIVCVNCRDLDDLGALYDQNAELFYETPIINIDHQSSNELFGEVNIVDLKASSTAEVIYSFLESFGGSLIDADTATCILSSVIASTKSFQTANTTPKSFALASELISLGANQQNIIYNLFKNKSLDSLKLWGRALARIKFDEENKIAWTLISSDDFKKTNSDDKNLVGVEEELATSVSGAEIVLILYERDNGIFGTLKAVKRSSLEKLSNALNVAPQNDLLNLQLGKKTLSEAEQEILKKIKGL